jgi:hypothetical protein
MGCALVACGSRSRCRFIISRGSGERIGDRRGPRPLRVRDHRRVTARIDGDHRVRRFQSISTAFAIYAVPLLLVRPGRRPEITGFFARRCAEHRRAPCWPRSGSRPDSRRSRRQMETPGDQVTADGPGNLTGTPNG